MSFLCSLPMKYAYIGAGAVASVASYAAAGFLTNSVPTIAKLFGETCPKEDFWNTSPGLCTSLANKVFYTSGSVSLLLIGTAATAVAVNLAVVYVQPIQEEAEAIPLRTNGDPVKKRRLQDWVAVPLLAGAFGMVEVLLNSLLTSAVRDDAIEWGRCLTQPNVTDIACAVYENRIYSGNIASNTIYALAGTILLGGYVLSGIKAFAFRESPNT